MFATAQQWVSAHKVFLIDVSWDYSNGEPEPYCLKIYFPFAYEEDRP